MHPHAVGSLLDLIGSTPIVRLNHYSQLTGHEYFAKLEYMNPGGSVKDRLGLALIKGAEERGELKPGGTIVEATSGNTGLGLAMIAAIKGYKSIFVMPDKISDEKQAILKAYGAKVIITPTGVEPEDPRSHLSVAKFIADNTENSFHANQYHNPDNVNLHYQTTGPEVFEQMSKSVDAFVAGAGTGGTISGVGRYLREKLPAVRIICADPIGSILYDLFYHGKVVDEPAPYKVEGVGEDMLPDNVHLKTITDFVQVTDYDSFHLTRDIIKTEGICVGPSSAMALKAAMDFAKKMPKGSRIVIIFPDHGRAYLSKAFNEKWLRENGLMKPNEATNDFAAIQKSDDYYKEMGWSFK